MGRAKDGSKFGRSLLNWTLFDANMIQLRNENRKPKFLEMMDAEGSSASVTLQFSTDL